MKDGITRTNTKFLEWEQMIWKVYKFSVILIVVHSQHNSNNPVDITITLYTVTLTQYHSS